MIFQAKFARKTVQLHVADDQIGLARRAVGNHRPLHARQNRLHVRLVQAKHDRAIERNAIRELEKRLLNFLERGVLVEVLAVNRGDDGDHRRKQQERAVALIRFHDHVFALAHARVRSRVIHAPADHKRRVETGSRQAPRRSSKWWWFSRARRRPRCRISGASAPQASPRAGSPEFSGDALRRLRRCPARTAEEITTTCAPCTFSA